MSTWNALYMKDIRQLGKGPKDYKVSLPTNWHIYYHIEALSYKWKIISEFNQDFNCDSLLSYEFSKDKRKDIEKELDLFPKKTFRVLLDSIRQPGSKE